VGGGWGGGGNAFSKAPRLRSHPLTDMLRPISHLLGKAISFIGGNLAEIFDRCFRFWCWGIQVRGGIEKKPYNRTFPIRLHVSSHPDCIPRQWRRCFAVVFLVEYKSQRRFAKLPRSFQNEDAREDPVTTPSSFHRFTTSETWVLSAARSACPAWKDHEIPPGGGGGGGGGGWGGGGGT